MGGVIFRGGRDAAVQFAPDGALRPPWSSEFRIRDACTSCGACVRACPESVLVPGRAGTPVVDFGPGACTFCAACAEACPEDVFDLEAAPWSVSAVVASECLLARKVSCRSCTDACGEAALGFDPRAGSVGRVWVDREACTGCGACLSVCPVGAIELTERPLSKGTGR